MKVPTDTELQSMVRADYLALAEALDAATGAWDTPSLCEGWRVREVVAHLAMPLRYDEAAFRAELESVEFDFTRLSNQVAERDGALPPAEQLAALRDPALHEWVPPGGDRTQALSHVVIHGLDITVPLGVPRCSPDATTVAVLDLLTAGGAHVHFGTDITGRRLVATDIDWAFGSGTELRAPASNLVLHLTGRHLPSPAT
jgi:uncharacterized protein (TIGR03083 family)